jgi:hypothetical protein
MKYILEPSSNTHVLDAEQVSVEKVEPSILKLKIQGKGLVEHGQHHVIKTEGTNVYKYVQQEINPITKQLQNIFD